MPQGFVKVPANISIIERRENLDAGMLIGSPQETQMTLAQKLDDYLLRLGYSNAYVLGIVAQLMTQGKVRVEFRDFRERLQLRSEDDLMSRTEAASMFDAYVSSLQSEKKSGASSFAAAGTTQRIVVQGPRKK